MIAAQGGARLHLLLDLKIFARRVGFGGAWLLACRRALARRGRASMKPAGWLKARR